MLPSIKKRRVEDGAVTGDNEAVNDNSENDVVMLSTDATSSSTALTTSNNVESLCTLLNKKSTTITNLSKLNTNRNNEIRNAHYSLSNGTEYFGVSAESYVELSAIMASSQKCQGFGVILGKAQQ